MTAHPPKPRLALTVGVIGHRPNRLPKDQSRLAALRVQIDQVLDMISMATCRALIAHHETFAPEPPLLSVLSGLAEGADRMAALAVTERATGEFRLDVALPFEPGEYKKDFKQIESQKEFDRLCELARAVLALPGTRQNAEDPDDADAKKAYEAQGLTVIGQCDILLTVWDGGASAGRGGTTDMLNTAARLGIPIVHIDANGAAAPCIRWNELNEHSVPVNAAEDFTVLPLEQKVLNRMVDRLVRPPRQEGRAHGLFNRHYSLPDYLHEWYHRLDIWFLYRFVYPLLLFVPAVRGFRGAETWPPSPAHLATELRGMAPPDFKDDPNATCERRNASRSIRLAGAYGWADSVGTRFSLIFRSAFVVNFMFAAFAVIAAAGSLIAFDANELHAFEREHLLAHKVPFVIGELVLIAIVLLNTMSGWLGRWQARWIQSREIAERLRAALPLWALGTRPTAFPGEEPTWTGWYARAVVRAQGMRHVTFDSDAIRAARCTLVKVLNDQCVYHRNTARRMSALESRLEGLGFGLFVITLFGVAGFLAARWLGWPITIWQGYLVTASAAGLPALATALYGIRVIGDFDGFAKRSKRMCERFADLIDAVESDWPKDSRQLQPPNFALLHARARAAETAMLSDVQNWRLAAESRELTIPG